MKYEPIKSDEAAVVMGVTNVAVCLTIVLVALIGSCTVRTRFRTAEKVSEACAANLARNGAPSDFCKEYLLK